MGLALVVERAEELSVDAEQFALALLPASAQNDRCAQTVDALSHANANFSSDEKLKRNRDLHAVEPRRHSTRRDDRTREYLSVQYPDPKHVHMAYACPARAPPAGGSPHSAACWNRRTEERGALGPKKNIVLALSCARPRLSALSGALGQRTHAQRTPLPQRVGRPPIIAIY